MLYFIDEKILRAYQEAITGHHINLGKTYAKDVAPSKWEQFTHHPFHRIIHHPR